MIADLVPPTTEAATQTLAAGIVQGRFAGAARYKGVLAATPTPRGIFLEVFPLFRPGHPSLFIPWGEFRERHPTPVRGLDFLAGELGRPRVGAVALSPEVFFPPS